MTFGEDTNNNNVPDANEGTVTLTYNANGGEGSAPAAQSANKWTAVTVTPATGDSFDPMFWTGMMLLALGAAAYVTLASKKSKKH